VEVRLDIGIEPSFVVRPHSPRVPPLILPPPEKVFMLGGEGEA